ncbi:unnamed protein product [Meganyctiphanes norvegica]|uniref:C2H2-type domain-containing protein n=1 Tax=Meganyctiphanes norvegica TaxID=48144 RepID=A0AAV2Q6S9_MEGNR
MAGEVSNFNNVLGNSSRQNILSRLGPQNFGNKVMGKNPKWPQQNATHRPHSKVKRLNQENKPKFNVFDLHLNKNKAKAMMKSSSKTIEVTKQGDDVPIEALHCHMCDLGDFGSISNYISHLEGISHDSMAKAYLSKCTANLEVFRAEAKITSHRVIVKVSKNVKKETQFCPKCQCQVLGGLAAHEKTSVHLQVLNYLGVRCCGTSFNDRIELEEHWLSLQHIQFRSKLFAKFNDLGFALQSEEKNRQKLSAKATAELQYDVTTWPAFDPKVPVGLRYVDIGASNKCRVCSEYLEPVAVVILSHCCSSKHYQNMCIFFKELQNNKITFSGMNKDTVAQNKNQIKAKDESKIETKAKSKSKNQTETKEESKNQTEEKDDSKKQAETKDENILSFQEISAQKSVEVKEVPSKVESVQAEAEPSHFSNTEDKKESNDAKTELPVTTSNAENEAEPEDEYGFVLDTSIILDESKNESMLEDKSDKEETELKTENKNNDEDRKKNITEMEQESGIIETKENISPKQESKQILNTSQEQVEKIKDTKEEPEQEKDITNDVQEQCDSSSNVKKEEEQENKAVENQISEELSSTSSSLTSKLGVIAEEECDECENGSDCKKHGVKLGSPKRKNSEDMKVELGTPKKLRTEEPVVGTPTRRSRRRSVSEEPTISTPTRSSRRKSISEEPTVVTPSRTSTRRRSITQL